MIQTTYPASVLEVLDDGMQFREAAVEAVQRFAASYPWRGDVSARKKKFLSFNRDLSAAYGIEEPDLHFGPMDGGSSSVSHYIPSFHRIVLVGKLSVVTYLHEFAHARGMGEQDACTWSINLFRRFFPRQFGRLIFVGHTLIRAIDVVSKLARRRAS